MLHNYHTHTFRNHHAVGTEREYIEAAIAGGYQTLGFSEHAPYQFPDGIVSYFHMFPEDLEDYIQTLLALKEEYAGRIEILIGYEAEYYPRFFDDLLARITQYPVDYLLLGQHYIRNEGRRRPARCLIQALDPGPRQQSQLFQPHSLRRRQPDLPQHALLPRPQRIQSHPPHFHGRTPLSVFRFLFQNIQKSAVS